MMTMRCRHPKSVMCFQEQYHPPPRLKTTNSPGIFGKATQLLILLIHQLRWGLTPATAGSHRRDLSILRPSRSRNRSGGSSETILDLCGTSIAAFGLWWLGKRRKKRVNERESSYSIRPPAITGTTFRSSPGIHKHN
ncbi:hypothetical protein BDM02DRAFT_1523877 [Thelephora ganbajun]|uniref:Uncharacterized protein n=1 Tax=Thelephora ganbajun TaxID=370292 RepID=A0ACB6Z1K1_THEGA|nr:hypothetical protein BDM02DRAFT_1523877 [Thelephora ganbajun]